MTTAPRTGVALVAGTAVVLSASMLSTLFGSFSWAIYAFLATAAVVLTAIVARAARVPVIGQLLAMFVALLLLLTWTFPSGHEFVGFLPTPRTFHHFHHLLTAAANDIQQLAIPVSDRASLDFLVTGGIGLVAVAVDVLAIGLRRPALAGLPLLALYSVPVAIRPDHVSWIPFALGAAGYLWLLLTDHVDRVRRWGRRFTGSGRDMDMWEPSPLAATGRRVGFAGLVLAVVLPLALPSSFSTGLLDRLSAIGTGVGVGNGTSQLGASINPITTLRGSLRMGEPINLFNLHTTDPSPNYLRTAVADQITESGFQPSDPSADRPLGDGPEPPGADVTGPLSHHEYSAQVEATNLDDRYLPLFANVTSLVAPRSVDWRYDPDTDVVYADAPATAEQRWGFSYDSFDYKPSTLRTAPGLDLSNDALAADTKVPDNSTIARRVARLTSSRATEYDKVRAILDFFSPSNGFEYSLQTKAGTSGSAIVDFLTNKRGYCEQYASAMTWMVRQAGIPARVVVGYTHGTAAGNNGNYQITSHDAHAWVEVYFPTYGWVPFDPTPSTGVSGSSQFTWAPNPSTAHTGDNTGGRVSNPGKTNPAGDGVKGQHGDAGNSGAGSSHPTGPTHWPYWLAGILALLGVLSLPALRRMLSRRRRDGAQHRGTQRAGTATRAAHAAWDELLDTLVDLRLDTTAPETPRATAGRLTAGGTGRVPPLSGDAATAVRLLATAEERARYARTPSSTADLPGAVHRTRLALRGSVSGRRRLIAAVAPRSVLLRWRAAIGSLRRPPASARNALARLTYRIQLAGRRFVLERMRLGGLSQRG